MSSTSLIPPQRDRFELPRETCYLNAAYMGPMPSAAVAAGQASYARKGQPWRYSVQADFFDAPEQLRRQAARLFGASPDDIALVPAASYGLASAARNLAPDAKSEILVLDEQFPSNVYVWRELAAEHGARLRTVSRSDNQSWTEAMLAAISPATSIVACPHVHWADGGALDLAAISDAARRQGAALVLDLTQSLGVMPFDLVAIQPDFAVAAAYKWLLGPYAMGFLYVAPHHQAGEPLEQNWIVRDKAEDFARLVDYADDHAPGARRFDMGERSNFQLVPAAIAALDAMLDWGADDLAATLGANNSRLAERLQPLGLTETTPDRAAHYLSLSLPSGAPADLVARLASRNIYVSQRGDRIRITPHVYNDEADFQSFATSLEDLL
ncbi:aminotransferase class V-fold PLP-dependent enzyme [uncultured Maricaulis sp.]|uniref:aminotransferase class V-fold PLP-dependent enzyme n=1 Tax=uncultured Maricaulis sp. TaxID=174710 RepID=UPI0026326FAF|nr:aminotransferase class V-fold PLP-dependent enzyme [uncultured Maricaulis sp.]